MKVEFCKKKYMSYILEWREYCLVLYVVENSRCHFETFFDKVMLACHRLSYSNREGRHIRRYKMTNIFIIYITLWAAVMPQRWSSTATKRDYDLVLLGYIFRGIQFRCQTSPCQMTRCYLFRSVFSTTYCHVWEVLLASKKERNKQRRKPRQESNTAMGTCRCCPRKSNTKTKIHQVYTVYCKCWHWQVKTPSGAATMDTRRTHNAGTRWTHNPRMHGCTMYLRSARGQRLGRPAGRCAVRTAVALA